MSFHPSHFGVGFKRADDDRVKVLSVRLNGFEATVKLHGREVTVKLKPT